MSIEPIPGFHEPLSSLSHLGGALVAAAAALPLLREVGRDRVRAVTLGVYVTSVVTLLAISGVYHLLDPAGAARQVLVRLDYAAIWLLIAGTFTPVHGVLFRGPWRWGFLAVVWGGAALGIVLKTVFFHQVPEWTVAAFYLGFGWLGALTGAGVRRVGLGGEVRWLIAGGALYSVGTLFDQTGVGVVVPGVVGPHEVFHLFVLGGIACHWRFIARVTDPRRSLRSLPPQSVAEASPRPAGSADVPSWLAAARRSWSTLARERSNRHSRAAADASP